MARAYVRCHKRYRYLCATGIFVVEFVALVLTHEFMIHAGIIATTYAWDALITSIEEEA